MYGLILNILMDINKNLHYFLKKIIVMPIRILKAYIGSKNNTTISIIAEKIVE